MLHIKYLLPFILIYKLKFTPLATRALILSPYEYVCVCVCVAGDCYDLALRYLQPFFPGIAPLMLEQGQEGGCMMQSKDMLT